VANDLTPTPSPEKVWWRSILIWTGLVQTVVAILDFLPTQEAIPEGWHKYIGLAAGILTIAARGLRPNDPISRRLIAWLVWLACGASILLVSASVLAETVVLPTSGKAVGYVRSDTPGKWIVLGAGLVPIKPSIHEGGKVCIFEGDSGAYAAIKIPPGDTDQPEVHSVILGSAGPAPKPPVIPKPDDPTPAPTITEKLGFVTLARDQGEKVAPAEWKAKAHVIADNFEGVSGGLAAGRFQAATPNATIVLAQDAILQTNRATIGGVGSAGRAAWLPFFEAWKVKSDTLASSGKLTKPEDYGQAYSETAAGLRLIVLPGATYRVSP